MSEFDALHELARDDLASVALGEAADAATAEHLLTCEHCRRELAAFRRVADAARGAGHLSQSDAPPPAVWQRISAETGGTDAPSGAPEPSLQPAPAITSVPSARVAPPATSVAAHHRYRHRRTGRLIAAAAAVLAVLAAGVTGWAVGRSSSPAAPALAMAAALQAQPGTVISAHGTAVMHATAGGFEMDVRTTGLPVRDGFYEVWLYDPSATKMVPVGLLGSGGRGSFTVPGGLDVAAYHVVDVSIQRYNGDPSHGTSALRGPLTR